jgi:hypothetical protein
VGENASQIEREIMEERNELGRNLEVLETKARDMADWRVHYRNHPGVFLGAAAGVGLLLGALSHRREHLGYVNYARTPEPRTARPRRSLGDRLHGPKGRKLVETWEHATEALMAIGTAKLVDFVSNYLPGFSEEYRRHSAHGGNGSNAFWQEQPASSGGAGFETSSRSGAWDAEHDAR